ncbi:MAG: pyridoxamine 5'-phosphate oxidase family protein [Nostocoides sp.]
MAQQFEEISPRLGEFIARQPMFFVATAARDGRVNVSPKGYESLRVLGPNRVVWLNLTGSGNETAGHLLDSPRMTLMFCSFQRQPLILRLYGTARAVHRRDPDWADLAGLFPPDVGARTVFDVTVEMVQTSCGYAVPLMTLDGERDLLRTWSAKKGEDGIVDYWRDKNQSTIDGAPTGLPIEPRSGR